MLISSALCFNHAASSETFWKVLRPKPFGDFEMRSSVIVSSCWLFDSLLAHSNELHVIFFSAVRVDFSWCCHQHEKWFLDFREQPKSIEINSSCPFDLINLQKHRSWINFSLCHNAKIADKNVDFDCTMCVCVKMLFHFHLIQIVGERKSCYKERDKKSSNCEIQKLPFRKNKMNNTKTHVKWAFSSQNLWRCRR